MMRPKSELATLALIPFFVSHPRHREELAFRVRRLLYREGVLSDDLEHFLQWAPEVSCEPQEGASRLRDLLRKTNFFTAETDKLLGIFGDLWRVHPRYREDAFLKLRDYYDRHDLLTSDVEDLLINAVDPYSPSRDREMYKRELVDCATREATDIAKQTAEAFFQQQKREFMAMADSRIDRLDAMLLELRHNTEQALLEQSDALRITSGEVQSYLWLTSCGVDLSVVRTTRYVPVRAYVADPVPNNETLGLIVVAIRRLATSLDLEVAKEFPPETGSWFKRFTLKTKALFTHDEVSDRLSKAEDALEATYLDRPKAEANKLQAEAASCLINALKETPHACIQVGSLLLVKSSRPNGESATFARTLTKSELKRLEESQFMLERPNEILDWLGSSRLPQTKEQTYQASVDVVGDPLEQNT